MDDSGFPIGCVASDDPSNGWEREVGSGGSGRGRHFSVLSFLEGEDNDSEQPEIVLGFIASGIPVGNHGNAGLHRL